MCLYTLYVCVFFINFNKEVSWLRQLFVLFLLFLSFLSLLFVQFFYIFS